MHLYINDYFGKQVRKVQQINNLMPEYWIEVCDIQILQLTSNFPSRLSTDHAIRNTPMQYHVIIDMDHVVKHEWLCTGNRFGLSNQSYFTKTLFYTLTFSTGIYQVPTRSSTHSNGGQWCLLLRIQKKQTGNSKSLLCYHFTM
jgi:hypothetical protein